MSATSLLRLPAGVRQQIWARYSVLCCLVESNKPITPGHLHVNRSGSRRAYATVLSTGKDDIWNKSVPEVPDAEHEPDRILDAARHALDAHTSASEAQKTEVLTELRRMIGDGEASRRARKKLRAEVQQKFSNKDIVQSLQRALLEFNVPEKSADLSSQQKEKLAKSEDVAEATTTSRKAIDKHEQLRESFVKEPGGDLEREECLRMIFDTYYSVAPSLFRPGSTPGQLVSVCARRGLRAKVKQSNSKRGKGKFSGTFQFISDGACKATVITDGKTPSFVAEKGLKELLVVLHDSGILDDVLYRPNDTSYPSGSIPEDGKAATTRYVRQFMDLPSEMDCPSMKLVGTSNVHGAFKSAVVLDILRACFRQNLEWDWKIRGFTRSEHLVGYELTVNIPGVVATSAAGEGGNYASAMAAAETHLLGKLYADGSLEKIYEAEKFVLPSSDLYPQAPKRMFAGNPRQQLEVLAGLLSAPLNVKESVGGLDSCQGLFACELEVEISGALSSGTRSIGADKKSAKKDAWTTLLASLHADGTLSRLLSEIYPIEEDRHAENTPLETETSKDVGVMTKEHLALLDTSKMDAEAKRAERNAKVEVFNFAASIGLVPEFDFKFLHPRTRKERIKKNKKSSKDAKLVLASVRLPALDIDVQGVGEDLNTAEIAAALAFKREVDTRYSTGALSADARYKVLSIETGREFFEYLRNSGKATSLELDTEPIAVLGTTQHKARLLVDHVTEQTVTMSTKTAAENVVYLIAAIVMAQQEPDLLEGFSQALLRGKGKILRDLRPLRVALGGSALYTMKDALVEARQLGLPDNKQLLVPDDSSAGSSSRWRRVVIPDERRLRSHTLQQALHASGKDSKWKASQEARRSLPMYQHTAQVLDLVAESTYSIIVGATGSGKTTQVPQILLDDAVARGKGGFCDIICTQPRRIAATSVASRVAAERVEPLQRSVGYQVRFDAKLPQPGGSITYCTTGILLEILKNDPAMMDRVSHIVLDEVHERDLQLDMLLVLLKRALKERQEAGKPVPKVVLMSATMDTDIFSSYFATRSGEELVPCPSLSVPGRTFPVQEKYMHEIIAEMSDAHHAEYESLILADKDSRPFIKAEMDFAKSLDQSAAQTEDSIDWKRERPTDLDVDSGSAQLEKEDALVPVALTAATVAHISKTSQEGAVLVFLPGLKEITDVKALLLQRPIFGVDFGNEERFRIMMLHSAVPPTEQKAVLDEVPQGCRKIILSTNIAETSVTVPDVRYVVDSGKLREKRYDQLHRISRLQCTWEARSNARQRAGRAGRVREGHYYALYSEARRQVMAASGLPELLRTDLQETCLAIKAQGFKDPVASYLEQTIQPPPQAAVDVAVENLQAIGAFTSDESLTTLGKVLSKLPLHPTLGKMVVLGIIFRCLHPLLILSSMTNEQSLFVRPIMNRQAVKASHRAFASEGSDHLASLEAFEWLRSIRDTEGNQAAFHAAHERFLHWGVFKSIASTLEQVEGILGELGLIPSNEARRSSRMQYGGQSLNEHSHRMGLIKCLLIAGLYPNIAFKMPGRAPVHRTATEHSVRVHPSSMSDGRPADDKQDLLYTYSALSKSSDGTALFMRDITRVDPLMVMLFSGKLEKVSSSVIRMDDWLLFRVQASDGVFAARLVIEFRKALDRLLTGAFARLNSGDEQSIARDPIIEKFVDRIAFMLDKGWSWREVGNFPSNSDQGGPNIEVRSEATRPDFDVKADVRSRRTEVESRPRITRSFCGDGRVAAFKSQAIV